ncbi:MAG TPA: ImmA/IrrE family metallo-endopeptidase [Hyphomicrobiaceae bacterium]|nr:ImmA/IrrE family metallo-endopeptidase [Hyphomicrobiaceae bacterium]
MDESDVKQKARQFVAKVDITSINEDLSPYLDAVDAKIVYEELGDGESGYTIDIKGKPRIVINKRESEERKRFTVCHEIAHIVLGLPSRHGELPSWSYAKRDFNETLCDMFATELLMPYATFKSKIPNEEPSVQVIEQLASEFKASFPATASRYAALVDLPCAFVTIDKGIIRHASRSSSLRNAKIWIAPRTPVMQGSVAHRLRAEGVDRTATEEVPQDLWFSDWQDNGDLWEISRHYARFDQTVSLLWFDEDELQGIEPPDRRNSFRFDEERGVGELTGELPWPGRSRRKR